MLPAGGVALAWLLLMTLWLPLLDYARSNRPWVSRIAPHVPAGACVWARGYSRAALASLEQYGRWRVDGRSGTESGCVIGLRQERRVMRLRPVNPEFVTLEGGDLQLSFDLPRGTYATTLLRELAVLEEPHY